MRDRKKGKRGGREAGRGVNLRPPNMFEDKRMEGWEVGIWGFLESGEMGFGEGRRWSLKGEVCEATTGECFTELRYSIS